MSITKTIFIIVAIAGVLAVAWFLQQRPMDKPVEQQQGIGEDPDSLVLKQLVAAGADLTKAHNVDFVLDLPDEARATKACDSLKKDGYTSKVQSAGEAKWRCLATKSLVPSHENIVEVGRRMEDLAKAHGGRYDGWGTVPEK